MANEKLYYAVYDAADPDPAAADDITNTGSTWYTTYGVDNANETAPLVDTTPFTFTDLATSLASGDYKVAIVWTADGGWKSNIAISSSFNVA